MSDRLLLLFARAPRSEARDKGLPEEPATAFFTALAREWHEAARRAGAQLAISAPPEDLLSWRRALPDSNDVVWLEQRGGSFGERLEDASRQAGRLARSVVVTGGDVVPDAVGLSAAFGALASGAEAVIAPAPDGGVSMLSLPGDSDLLRSIGRRRRNVFRSLRSRLLSRGRAVRVVASVADVDGPGALRNVIVPGALEKLVSQLRRACRPSMPRDNPSPSARPAPARSSAIFRGPPLPA